MTNLEKSILPFLFLSITSVPIAMGQATIQDTGKFNEAISWLEEYMVYSYKNKSTGKWWNNNLFYEAGEKTLNVKSTSSDIPNGAKKHVYYDRKISLKELDISTVRIEKTEKGGGRIPKGRVVMVNVVGNEKRIVRSFNGKPSLKESSLQFVFPESDSSLYARADNCKKYLSWAIDYASRVYPSDAASTNIDRLFQVLPGTYSGTDGSTCEVIKLFPNTLELKFSSQGQLYQKSIINYREATNAFTYWQINETEADQFPLELKGIKRIELNNTPNNFSISIIGLNQINIAVDGETVDYFRSKLE